MDLIIAEKPDMGRKIAAALSGARPRQGYIKYEGGFVSWCFGHLIDTAPPEAYDQERFGSRWNWKSLPIFPGSDGLQDWIEVPTGDKKKQVALIRDLLKKVDRVVHAGDPDREGQLIVDELLVHLRWKKPVVRLLLTDLNKDKIAAQLVRMVPNSEFKGLYEAALGRRRADWLVGMNLTRAYSIRSGELGGDFFAIGRVQTPTLALVVRRDREIENFRPKDFFVPWIKVRHPHGEFRAEWLPPTSPPDWLAVDEEGRLLDRNLAGQLIAATTDASAIAHYESKAHSAEPPLPHDLEALQADASRAFGFGAQQTLDVAQSLYEKHQLTTYPRTEVRHVPTTVLPDVPHILRFAGGIGGLGDMAAAADLQRRSKAFNDGKLKAHHGIIPTTKDPSSCTLSSKERQLYGLIMRQYLAQFHPPHRYETRKTVVETGGFQFQATGRRDAELGWKAFFRADKEDEDDDSTALPVMGRGDRVTIADRGVAERQTKPPLHYTEGTLVKAMANIARMVQDPAMKARLRESAGIGTPATRGAIIEKHLGRQLLQKKGKYIVSTDLGRQQIDACDPMLADPAVTALWEQELKRIEERSLPLPQFLATIEKMVRAHIEKARNANFRVVPQKHSNGARNGRVRQPSKRVKSGKRYP